VFVGVFTQRKLLTVIIFAGLFVLVGLSIIPLVSARKGLGVYWGIYQCAIKWMSARSLVAKPSTPSFARDAGHQGNQI